MPIATAVVACALVTDLAAAPVPVATDFDIQKLVDDAVKGGAKRVVVPPGRYRVTPKHNVHLSLRDLSNVQVVADGVEMVCTQTVRAMALDNCRNVRVTGLTIDYDPLPMTEGRITALPPDKSWAEFEVIPGYPEDNLLQRVEIYDPATGELRRTDGPWVEEFKSLGNHRYRIAKRPGYRCRPEVDTEQVGDILVTINAFPTPKAGGHCVELSRCAQVTLERITTYASPSMGFVEHGCDGTAYLRCRIDRRSLGEDPVRRGFARMRSLTADGFHCSADLRGPSIVECVAKYQGDDCINIHGSYHFVSASEGSSLRVAAAPHSGRMTIEAGDPLEFLPFEGQRPPDAVAVSIEPDAPMTEAEIALVKKINLLPRNKEKLLEGKVPFFRVKLDRAVSLPPGSAVCAGNRTGNDFLVQGNDFGFNRSRGILIKASRGRVVGNTITHGWMAAVLVAPEFWWFESSSSSDVVIADNKIIGCRRAAIDVIAPGGSGKPLPAGAHRNITVSGNTFERCVWPNIHVTSTRGLVIKDNKLTTSDPTDLVPPVVDRWKWKDAAPSPIVTELCEDAQIQAPTR